MASKIKGITITLGADVQPLNKALEGVNKKSRDLQSELKQVDRLLKLDPKNTELLAQKQKLLTDAVGNTKTKLDTLKEAEKQVQEQFKNGDIGEEQYRAVQREVVKTEQELKSLEKQLGQTNINWEETAKKIDNFGKKASEIGKTMSMSVTAPIIGAGAIAFKYASDLEDAFGATEQIYKGSSDEVKTWADSLESYYGIAEGEALEYANTMGAMLQNIGGLSEAEAAKQSATLVELAGDLAAMFGGSTESAVQALTGALKGNNSMLDNYGMGVNEATIKTKALEMGLIKEGEQLDLAGKQSATLALIMEQTADAQGQAAKESEGASGSMRALTTELKNLAGDLGEELLPVITPFITKIKEMVQGFSELSPETKKTIVTIAAVAAAIGPLLMIIGSLASGISAIITIAPALGVAFTIMTGPVGLVVAAIAGVVAIGVALYKNWDTIKEKAGQLGDWMGEKWNGIKEKTSEVWGNVKETMGVAMSAAKENVAERLSSMKQAFDENGGGIKGIVAGLGKGIKDNFTETFSVVDKLTGGKLSDIKGKFKTSMGAIKDDVSNRLGKMKQAFNDNGGGIKGIVAGLTTGIKDNFTTTMSSIDTLTGGKLTSIKKAFTDKMGDARDAVKSSIDKIKGFFNFNWELPKLKMPKFSITGEFSLNPPKVPKFGISWHKEGAIFTKPTLFNTASGMHGVGEAGAEAVLPIEKLDGIIASALQKAGGSGGNITIQNVVTLDGRIVAQTVNKVNARNDRRFSPTR